MTTTETTPTTITITQTAPGAIADDTNRGTAVLVEPGTYAIESIDHDAQMVYIDVPAVQDWYVAVHIDVLLNDDEVTGVVPARPKR